MLKPLADKIASSDLSLMLQTQLWIVPTSQSIHILSVGVLFACALVINSRIFGIGSSGRTVLQLVEALVPCMWIALAGLLITGSVQTIAEPVRQFITPMFWAKMTMIVVVVVMTKVFAVRARANAKVADTTSSPGARIFAVTSSVLWIAIIVCGRFIGYTWALYLPS